MSEKEQILEGLILELRRGTLVLSVMSQLRQPEYGYSLSSKLNEKGLEIDQNTLYPLLRRLEKNKLLDSKWSLEESRQRRYYQLSQLGEEVFEGLLNEWNKMASTIESIIEKEE